VTGHNAAIAGMAVASDKSTLYTADTDGIVVEWDLTTGTAVKRLQGGDTDLLYKTHGDATISCLTYCFNKLLTAGWDDKVRVHPISTSESIALEAQPSAMSCGTNLVAVLTVGGIVLLQNGLSTSPMIPLDGFAGLCVCLSKDDSTLYVGGEDCKIHVYKVAGNIDALEKVHVIENGHLKPVHALRLSHDETKLASADVRDVCVWSLPDYTPIIAKGRWCFHTQRISCLAWAPNDQVLASASGDDSIYLWSSEKKAKRVHYPYCHRGGITGLEFIGDWKLVSVGNDACVNQWDVTDDVATKFG
jgi:WD40 repeat protein